MKVRFSERGARLTRRDEGAARQAVTEEATPSAGMPRPKTYGFSKIEWSTSPLSSTVV